MAHPSEQDEELLDGVEQQEEEVDEPDFEIPDEGEVFVPEQAQLSRKEKKANRFAEQIRMREEAERERDEARREAEELRRRAQAAPSAPAAPPVQDEYRAKIDEAQERKTKLFEDYNNAVAAAIAQKKELPEETKQRFLREARQMDEEIVELVTERKLARSQGNQAGRAAQQAVLARHHDVFGHELAAQTLRSEYYAAIAPRSKGGEGKPDDMETMDEVADRIRQRFRLGKFRHGGHDVPESQARKYSGVPGSGGAPRAPERRGYTMSELDREMADIAFPNLPPAERYKRFAEGMKNEKA